MSYNSLLKCEIDVLNIMQKMIDSSIPVKGIDNCERRCGSAIYTLSFQ